MTSPVGSHSSVNADWLSQLGNEIFKYFNLRRICAILENSRKCWIIATTCCTLTLLMGSTCGEISQRIWCERTLRARIVNLRLSLCEFTGKRDLPVTAYVYDLLCAAIHNRH